MQRRRSPYESPPPSSRRSGGSRRRSSSPRGGRGEPPTSLLVRNISRDTRADDLRGPFERYGAVKDVYLPKDFYSGEPRGFGFVQFIDPRDAIEAQYKMNHQLIRGREVSVVFAEETRKKPAEMRMKETSRDRPSSRRSPRRGRSRSRSRSPRHPSASPRRRRHSRSYSPSERRGYDRQDRQYYSPRPRDSYKGSPPSGYNRRDHFPPVSSYPHFMHPGMGRFDMFGAHHPGVIPPYPPYHHPGANRVWDM
ncbi:serine/arginine-rich SC35-like splicing factor SCL33 isoform X1 [Selaginella moellendorffii]|nr:serine/arginine-rich SC35-like splicing factor SCL33 isoform X1 [Selaginella moellendorffii]|eukprot:XP_024533570.1 serine/arginine-rich SC35-like splicing factor SCL33 isoform X1 [Selaginella moellendorffii]